MSYLDKSNHIVGTAAAIVTLNVDIASYICSGCVYLSNYTNFAPIVNANIGYPHCIT